MNINDDGRLEEYKKLYLHAKREMALLISQIEILRLRYDELLNDVLRLGASLVIKDSNEIVNDKIAQHYCEKGKHNPFEQEGEPE